LENLFHSLLEKAIAKQLTELTALENAMQMAFSDNPK